MNFEPVAGDEAFRASLREYIAASLQELFGTHDPAAWRAPRDRDAYRKVTRQWTRVLDARGLLVPHWPLEWGGTDCPAHWRRILEEELACARCPLTDGIGTDFVGPVICAFGSVEQKRRYLPAIRSAEQLWCQGFSEPQAGSDVMSIRATARPQGDKFIVNGHKLWTSNAHNADMMFALVRMELPGARRQAGLSFLLIDMRSPGVTVRPVILIDGVRRVNEVMLEEVPVPQANLIGEPGKGWVYARYLLTNERTHLAGLGMIRNLLEDLRHIAAGIPSQGMPCDFSARLSQFEIELHALEYMQLRLLQFRQDEGVSQILAPILKLRGCELRQRITDLTMQLLGERGLELPFHAQLHDSHPSSAGPPLDPAALSATIGYLFHRSATLAGGASEIQRNLLAGVVLQL